MTLAARRTNIDTPNFPVDVRDLLQRVGYSPTTGSPRVGDVAVYVNTFTGRVDHTGIVSRWNLAVQPPELMVWSMWGGLGEFEHRPEPQRTPYEDCSVEYWRL